jgi:hypothetical protein
VVFKLPSPFLREGKSRSGIHLPEARPPAVGEQPCRSPALNFKPERKFMFIRFVVHPDADADHEKALKAIADAKAAEKQGEPSSDERAEASQLKTESEQTNNKNGD